MSHNNDISASFMDLASLINDFLEYLEIERNVSKLTIRNYRHYLERFLGFMTGVSPSASPVVVTPDGFVQKPK